MFKFNVKCYLLSPNFMVKFCGLYLSCKVKIKVYSLKVLLMLIIKVQFED